MNDDLRSLFGTETGPPGSSAPGPRRSWRQAWPTLFLIPFLIAALHASAWSLLISILFGETFGLSGGRPEPWPGAIALLWLAAFWSARIIGRSAISPRLSQVLTVACWAAAVIAWFAIEPVYRESMIWRDPASLVQDNGYLIPPILMSMAIWWQGMRYALDLSIMTAEELRGVTQRDWLILGGSILFSVMVGGEAGGHALTNAKIAVPLTVILSLALVAAAEVEMTRRLAVRRGGQPPGWERWARLVSGLGAGVIVVSLLVLALLSPGLLSAAVGGIAAVLKLVGLAIVYIFYSLFFVLYQLVRAITGLLEYIFGDIFGPIQLPEQVFQQPPPLDERFPEREPPDQWEYAILLRWIALGIAIAVIAILLFRFTRKRGALDDTGQGDATRDSVFSADLAKKQLRDFFRRRHREQRAPPLDLNTQPATIRDSMLYLQALAHRQDVGRREAETPDDFVRRLRGSWPGLGAPLNDLADRYERIRYGERPDTAESPDHRPAIEDWAHIWRVRKDVEPPPAKGSDSP